MKPLGIIALIILSFCGVLYLLDKWDGRNRKPRYYNPRHAVNGVDTVYTKDSIYSIRVVIDDVQEIEREYDPPDRRP